MELIHADSEFNELGFIDFNQFDGVISLAPELESNDWEADICADDFERYDVKIGDYLYFPDTEWGGPIEKIEHVSSRGVIKIYGITWRGMLIRKVIVPPTGTSHLDTRGVELSAVISVILNITGLGKLFTGPSELTGKISKRQFRYNTVFEGINDMLNDVDCRLELILDADSKKVVLSVKDVIDHSDEIEFSEDYDMSFTSTLATAQYNHIIALGQGELEERTVQHVWLLPNGTTTTDSNADGILTGLQEKTLVYDYPNCEEIDELIDGAKKKLLEYATENAINFDWNSADIDLPLGDKVGMRDRITGMSDVKTISQKLLTITSDGITLQYSVE